MSSKPRLETLPCQILQTPSAGHCLERERYIYRERERGGGEQPTDKYGCPKKPQTICLVTSIIRADVWEGDATKRFSVIKGVFQ